MRFMLESNLAPKGSPGHMIAPNFYASALAYVTLCLCLSTCKHPCAYACAYAYSYACVVCVN